MSALTFKPAERKGIKPLIGLFGKSGSGKTLTALLLGRGMAGPSGKLGLVDTENERAQMFHDLVPGGFLHLNLEAPFSPDRYSEVLDVAESSHIDVLIIDSATHEWNGEGGYLDMKEAALDRMAGSDWKKRDKCAMAAAAQCKPKHNKFVAKLLRSKMTIILCFRAKDLVKMEKNVEGKIEIQKSDHANPIQDSGLIFEMLISSEVVRVDGLCGCLRVEAEDPNTKWTHPDILQLLPKPGEQTGVKHGEAIARWCANPSGGAVTEPKPAQPGAAKPKASAEDLRKRILAIDAERFPSIDVLSQYLYDEGLMDTEHESFEELSVERLMEVGKALKAKLVK